MGAHNAAVPRADQAVAVIQLRITVPKDIRAEHPYPTSYDAGNVVRALMQKWERGELSLQELFDLADDTSWQITK